MASWAGRSTFLPFAPPTLGKAEIAEVVATLRSGWLSTGPRARQFELEFARFVGAPEALALSSGTAALHLALMVLGVGPGDGVIVPTLTFSSCAHVVEHFGARPILVDVEPRTLTIDLNQVEAVLAAPGAGNIRAVMPVHLYGQPCDLAALDEIALRYSIHLVEDAAHALPSQSGTTQVGAVRLNNPSGPNNLVAFSFYATKNITTAEGGMLTGPPTLLERARVLSMHGMTRDAHARYTEVGSWQYDVVTPGFKYNLSDLQAALGLVQLRRLPAFRQRRSEVAARYSAALSIHDALEVPWPGFGQAHAWHLYVIRLRLEKLRINRARFIEELRARNIGSSVHFIPIHMLTYYRDRYGYSRDQFPVASREFDRLVSLPMHAGLTDADVDDVVDAVCEVASRYRA